MKLIVLKEFRLLGHCLAFLLEKVAENEKILELMLYEALGFPFIYPPF